MTHLVIGKDVIEIRTAIKTVKSNINMLKERMESISMDCAIGRRMNLFYAKEMDKYEATLMWLSQYEPCK